ncbi:MAG: P-loop NTPase fold protein [Methylococcales bacterium]|nr:P-loop NTPase fold protein [Methylococcales bacterium]
MNDIPVKVSNEVEIKANEPFQNDKLGRKESAEILTQFIKSSNGEPLVLCINAPWGQGKTTFLKMWQTYLQNEDNGFETIYFDSWKNDFTDDALVAILGEISSFIDTFKDDNEEINNKFKKATGVATKFLRKGVPALIKGATYNFLDLDSGIENAAAALAESVTNDVIDHYVKSKKSLDDFKELLTELASDISSDKPIVFIIDELDRCRPNFAVEVLEKVKHFFSVKNIVFVLGADKEQLGNSMKMLYGNELDVSEYLRRFIDFDYALPTPDNKQFIGALFEKYKFDSRLTSRLLQDSLDIFSMLFSVYKLTFRQQEHCCSLLNLAIRTSKSENDLHIPLLCFLITIKICNSIQYDEFVDNKIDALQFFESKIKDSGIKIVSRYLLLVSAYLKISHIGYNEIDNVISEARRNEDNRGICHALEQIYYNWDANDSFKSIIKKIEIAEKFS